MMSRAWWCESKYGRLCLLVGGCSTKCNPCNPKACTLHHARLSASSISYISISHVPPGCSHFRIWLPCWQLLQNGNNKKLQLKDIYIWRNMFVFTIMSWHRFNIQSLCKSYITIIKYVRIISLGVWIDGNTIHILGLHTF